MQRIVCNYVITGLMKGGQRDTEMKDFRNHIGNQSDKIEMNLVIDLPLWLEKAVEQKNPKVTLALAYTLLLSYDDLDKKLFPISALNWLF